MGQGSICSGTQEDFELNAVVRTVDPDQEPLNFTAPGDASFAIRYKCTETSCHKTLNVLYFRFRFMSLNPPVNIETVR